MVSSTVKFSFDNGTISVEKDNFRNLFFILFKSENIFLMTRKYSVDWRLYHSLRLNKYSYQKTVKFFWTDDKFLWNQCFFFLLICFKQLWRMILLNKYVLCVIQCFIVKIEIVVVLFFHLVVYVFTVPCHVY